MDCGDQSTVGDINKFPTRVPRSRRLLELAQDLQDCCVDTILSNARFHSISWYMQARVCSSSDPTLVRKPVVMQHE